MSMLMVKIHYGPCDVFHSRMHRPQKLKGVRDQLLKYGYRVILVPTKFINMCRFEVCGYEVFSCNIKNLKFNFAVRNDPVGQKAVEAVLEASKRMTRARSYLWTWMLIEDQMFKRSAYAPKDHWQIDVDFVPMNMECSDCCKILTTSKEQQDYQVKEQDSNSDRLMLTFDEGFSK